MVFSKQLSNPKVWFATYNMDSAISENELNKFKELMISDRLMIELKLRIIQYAISHVLTFTEVICLMNQSKFLDNVILNIFSAKCIRLAGYHRHRDYSVWEIDHSFIPAVVGNLSHFWKFFKFVKLHNVSIGAMELNNDIQHFSVFSRPFAKPLFRFLLYHCGIIQPDFGYSLVSKDNWFLISSLPKIRSLVIGDRNYYSYFNSPELSFPNLESIMIICQPSLRRLQVDVANCCYDLLLKYGDRLKSMKLKTSGCLLFPAYVHRNATTLLKCKKDYSRVNIQIESFCLFPELTLSSNEFDSSWNLAKSLKTLSIYVKDPMDDTILNQLDKLKELLNLTIFLQPMVTRLVSLESKSLKELSIHCVGSEVDCALAHFDFYKLEALRIISISKVQLAHSSIKSLSQQSITTLKVFSVENQIIVPSTIKHLSISTNLHHSRFPSLECDLHLKKLASLNIAFGEALCHKKSDYRPLISQDVIMSLSYFKVDIEKIHVVVRTYQVIIDLLEHEDRSIGVFLSYFNINRTRAYQKEIVLAPMTNNPRNEKIPLNKLSIECLKTLEHLPNYERPSFDMFFFYGKKVDLFFDLLNSRLHDNWLENCFEMTELETKICDPLELSELIC